MNRLLSLTLASVLAVSFAAALTGCGGTECGLGTTKQGDQCVPLCGDGEYWNANEKTCLPVIECAEGTEFNPLTGQCEPGITECAEGTELINGECVPECIDGEEYWNGTACKPIPECADGTVFNPNTNECDPVVDGCAAGTHLEEGVCVPDVVCGPGTHAFHGQCVPNVLEDPDIVEGDENNDIFYPQWTATIVNLPAIDDHVTLGGTVRAPTDLDDDGIADADYDAFILVPPGGEGLGGTYLHIEATSESTCLPALMIVGVEEETWELVYYRYALNPNGVTTIRDAYLPADGIYFILVTDYNNLVNDAFGLDGIPVGGDDFTYFVTVEHREVPTATDISGFPYNDSGDFSDGGLAFYSLPSLLADDILRITASSVPAGAANDVMPVAMLFGPDGTLLKELTITSTGEDLDLHYYAETDGDLLLVLDYFMLLGPNRGFELNAGLREPIDMTDVTSPWDSELLEDEDLLLMWNMTAGDFIFFNAMPPEESRVNLQMLLYDAVLDPMIAIDEGSCGEMEGYYFYIPETSRLFLQLGEADGKPTPFSMEIATLATPLIEAGNDYEDLQVADMPEGTFPDAAIEHFDGSFGQLVFFYDFTTHGSWWASPLEQIYTPMIDLMGPMMDATGSSVDYMPYLSAFIPYDGDVLHLVWDPDANPETAPENATYDTTFHSQDTTDMGLIESGTHVSRSARVLDPTSGTSGFVVSGNAAQPMTISVTPNGADFLPQVSIFTFGQIEGDGYFVPYYWASNMESWQMGRVAVAVAENPGESIEVGFVSPYPYYSLITVEDAGGNVSPGTFDIEVSGPTAPANDLCEDAEAISLTEGAAEIEGTTMGADSAVDEVSCVPADYPPYGPDVFYSIDLAEGDTINATFSGSFDGALYLIDDCDCPYCGCVAGADAAYSPPDEDENISYTVKEGEGGTFYLVVDSWSPFATGNFTLSVEVN